MRLRAHDVESKFSESDVLSAETETTWQYLVRDIECEVTVYNTWKDAAELHKGVSRCRCRNATLYCSQLMWGRCLALALAITMR